MTDETDVREGASWRANASLVLGILAISGALPCVGSLLAIGFAVGEDSSTARAGLVLGCLSLVAPLLLLVLFGCLGVPLFVLGVF